MSIVKIYQITKEFTEKISNIHLILKWYRIKKKIIEITQCIILYYIYFIYISYVHSIIRHHSFGLSILSKKNKKFYINGLDNLIF